MKYPKIQFASNVKTEKIKIQCLLALVFTALLTGLIEQECVSVVAMVKSVEVLKLNNDLVVG